MKRREKRRPRVRDSGNTTQNVTFIGRDDLVVIVLVLALVAAVAGLAIALRAIGKAESAQQAATIAEREGRLAEEAAMHLRSTMRAYGIQLRGKDEDQREEEPVEP